MIEVKSELLFDILQFYTVGPFLPLCQDGYRYILPIPLMTSMPPKLGHLVLHGFGALIPVGLPGQEHSPLRL